jgi:hypothetical protein
MNLTKIEFRFRQGFIMAVLLSTLCCPRGHKSRGGSHFR